MTQYNDRVERQRLMLEAEEWAGGVKELHCFDTRTTSVWYETRPDDGRVMDIRFNDNTIRRELRPSGKIIIFGEKLKGQDLLDAYTQNLADSSRG